MRTTTLAHNMLIVRVALDQLEVDQMRLPVVEVPEAVARCVAIDLAAGKAVRWNTTASSSVVAVVIICAQLQTGVVLCSVEGPRRFEIRVVGDGRICHCYFLQQRCVVGFVVTRVV